MDPDRGLTRLRIALTTAAGLTALWYLVVYLSGVPPYIPPPPHRVLWAWLDNAGLLATHGLTTLADQPPLDSTSSPSNRLRASSNNTPKLSTSACASRADR